MFNYTFFGKNQCEKLFLLKKKRQKAEAETKHTVKTDDKRRLSENQV